MMPLTCEEVSYPRSNPRSRGGGRWHVCGKPAKWHIAPGGAYVCGAHVRWYKEHHGYVITQIENDHDHDSD